MKIVEDRFLFSESSATRELAIEEGKQGKENHEDDQVVKLTKSHARQGKLPSMLQPAIRRFPLRLALGS